MLVSAFCSPGVHSARNRNEYHSCGGKVRPAHRADNSAVQVVSNVNVKMEAQHSISPLSLHYLFRESLTFNLWIIILCTVVCRGIMSLEYVRLRRVQPQTLHVQVTFIRFCIFIITTPKFTRYVNCLSVEVASCACRQEIFAICGLLKAYFRVDWCLSRGRRKQYNPSRPA